jgi:hypothetical protein
MKHPNQNIATTKSSRNHSALKAARALGALLLLVSSAPAQVTSQSVPFTGQHQEDFETSIALPYSYMPNPVFQGNASYCTSTAAQTNIWFSGPCTTNPHGGFTFVGDVGGTMWFDFNVAPTRFGGYFGSNQVGGPAVVTVNFLSATNSLITTDVIQLQNNCSWTWIGWDIQSTNVRRIEFQYSGFIEKIMMDDLELDFAPIVNSCFETFCFGDSNLATGQCPCGNGLPFNTTSGCVNGTGVGGVLTPTGSCAATVGDAGLVAENLVPNQWALFFEGSAALPAGGIPFADGRLCVGGPYAGIKLVKVNAAGIAGPIGDVWWSGLGPNAHMPGDTSYYQCYYNDPFTTVCGSRWNLTNGVKMGWTP